MTVSIVPLRSAGDPRFDAVTAIYRDAIEPSEQKSLQQLRAQIDDDRYACLIAEAAGGEIIGFAITFIPHSKEFWLLEYVAVAGNARSSGLGSALLTAAVAYAAEHAPGAPGILEVDAPRDDLDASSPIRRRLAFYARHGCRLIEGLSYILPLSHAGTPPPMQLLLLAQTPPATLAREDLQRWLATLYSQVYGKPADDPRITTMISPLPPEVRITARLQ